MRRAPFIVAAFPLLAGCAPAINVFGASFPDWLFCISGGVLGTVAVHTLVRKRAWLEPLAVSYPALTALFAMVIWLLAFPN